MGPNESSVGAVRGLGEFTQTQADLQAGSARRFETILAQAQQFPTVELNDHDVYLDKVGGPAQAPRGSQLPDDVTRIGNAVGKDFRDAFADAQKAGDEITDPYAAVVHDAMMKFQNVQVAMIGFQMTTKTVEFAVQGFQSLAKQQG
jgi:hypothetical protein